MDTEPPILPRLLPLGDRALLVRFGETLSDAANLAAISFAKTVLAERPPGVLEVVPNLVSVMLRYDPSQIEFDRLAGEVRLLVSRGHATIPEGTEHVIAVAFEGEDIDEVASLLSTSRDAFVADHCQSTLRVLATGFAPGFVYVGFHPPSMQIPRRGRARRQVPAGTVLFAAGQTAITSTAIPTGWHIIGHTGFRNFDATATPPTLLRAGDTIRFEVAS